MHARQYDRDQYFNEQAFTTEKYVIPYINEILPVTPDITVAEIGCGEGGNLKPFVDKGCKVVGIDLADWKIKLAEQFFENHPLHANVKFISKDVYDLGKDGSLKFDLIIMRDTLEHIPNQDVFLEHLKLFLKPNGIVFFSFPAWRMPFGGHQQMCHSKVLSVLPYFHILPRSIFRIVLKAFGETDGAIEGLLEVKDTKISIQKYHSILSKRGYMIQKESHYLINPNYEVKFKLKPRLLPFFLNIPYFRDFFVTTLYSITSLNK